jgi:nicotinate-nucleotide pyrophosphorylase (carboxylating)
VLAGLPLAGPVFRSLDPDADVTCHLEDGERVAAGSRVLTVRGLARAVLSGERTALNLLCHLSGVATLTAAFVEAAMATGVRILDTRKTLPGWRALEKYAVCCGGGENHRMDLADAAMVKENHLYAAFGRTGPDAIREAVTRCKAALPEGLPLYVEVENHEELEAAASAGASVLMLDGFDLGDIRRAVKTVRGLPPPRPELEVTGGVTLENVAAFAAAGAQRISIGALTHSAPALDLHLRVRGGA